MEYLDFSFEKIINAHIDAKLSLARDEFIQPCLQRIQEYFSQVSLFWFSNFILLPTSNIPEEKHIIYQSLVTKITRECEKSILVKFV